MDSRNASIEVLPAEVIVDILSRLPPKTIIHCKCVCKKWRNLVSNTYFVNLHLSRSPVGIIIHHISKNYDTGGYVPGILKWVEIEDKLDHHRLHHDPLMDLDLNLAPTMQDSQICPVGSVNGLICLWQYGRLVDNTYICNPITREYMILPRQQYYRQGYAIIVYGFGVSSLTGEYKVMRIFQGDIPPNPSGSSRPSLLEAEVYTLGKCQWRTLGHVPYWLNGFYGLFLNGHFHWIVCDEEDTPERICTFDLDKETFQLFPSPPIEVVQESVHFQSLAILKGCLCQSDTYEYSQFTMWVMKEYGIKKSWHKEVVIKQAISPNTDWLTWGPMYLIESLKDGCILMIYYEDRLFAYSPKSKAVEDTEIFDSHLYGMAYRPSFVKLQNFKSESVLVF